METIDLSEVAIATGGIDITSLSHEIQNIYKRVRGIVTNYLPLGEEGLTNNVNFIEELNPDSFDNLHMIMSIEDRFDIKIPDETAEKLVSLDQIVGYITTVKTIK